MESEATEIRCSRCSTARKTKRTKKDGVRLPPGWKRGQDQQPICSECWRKAYVLRAVTIPVAEPIDATKDELWTAARACWDQATTAANLAVQALCRADVIRLPTMEKLPPMPRVYLYGEIPPSVSGMDPASYVGLLHAVERRYREKRYGLVWLRNERPPLYQSPTPYPIPPANWRAKIDEAGGHPLIECRFAGRWWTLRLRGGWQFKRLLAAHQKIVDGDALPVEGAIYQSGSGKTAKLMFKMVAWFPREKQPERSAEMIVTTGGDAFCVAVIGHRDPWRLNADQVRRWIAEHEKYRQRMADDLKYEKRWPKEQREQMLRAQDQRCRRQQHRLKNFIGTATKMLAGFAARNGVAHVTWDDRDRSYLPSFPWFAFRSSLAYKLDELGITLTCEGSGDATEPGELSQESNLETSQ